MPFVKREGAGEEEEHKGEVLNHDNNGPGERGSQGVRVLEGAKDEGHEFSYIEE